MTADAKNGIPTIQGGYVGAQRAASAAKKRTTTLLCGPENSKLKQTKQKQKKES
jgi:hypothetical protein